MNFKDEDQREDEVEGSGCNDGWICSSTYPWNFESLQSTNRIVFTCDKEQSEFKPKQLDDGLDQLTSSGFSDEESYETEDEGTTDSELESSFTTISTSDSESNTSNEDTSEKQGEKSMTTSISIPVAQRKSRRTTIVKNQPTQYKPTSSL